LVERLLQQGQQVVGIDNLFSTDRRVIGELINRPGFRFVEGSITDPECLSQAFRAAGSPDVVYHLAAQASGHTDAADPLYTESTNLSGSRMVLDAMLKHGVASMVFGSSFRVYGPDPQGRIDEHTGYGAFGDLSHLSKVYVEKLMEMYALKYDLNCSPVRIGVVYGVAPVMKTDYRFMTVANKFCLQVLKGERLTVNPTGLAITPFIHVDDAAEAMLVAGDRLSGYAPANAVTESLTVPQVANVVGEEARRRGLASAGTIQAGPGPELTVESVLDAAGFRAKWDLRAGVQQVLDYFVRVNGGTS
jgi:UDP-glucose 4-epimerase